MKNKSIIPINNKGQRHGYWEVYFDDDLMLKGFYQNDKSVGYEETYYCFSFRGKLRCKQYYI